MTFRDLFKRQPLPVFAYESSAVIKTIPGCLKKQARHLSQSSVLVIAISRASKDKQ